MVDLTPAPDIEAFRLMRAGKLQEALPFAERAVAGRRMCAPAHGMLAAILLQLGRAAEAGEVIVKAGELESGMADAYDGLAYVSMGLGWHERANAFYRRAATLSPRVPRFWYNLACSERSLGRLEEAEAACDQAVGIDAAQYPSYLLRSELRVQTPQSNHVEELERLLAQRPDDHRAQMFLGFALGKELDDLQDVGQAFRRFSAAAHVRRSRLQYDIAEDERKLSRIAEVYPQPGGRRVDDGRIETSRYIFIVGLPRSGTTLVERILTGLAGVRSNGETENFSRSLMAATRVGAGDLFARAAQADAAVVAAHYAQAAKSSSSSGAIIEKLPMNFLYLGAIHRALPDARILVLRRSPLDSCFAMYRTLFGEAYPFSYDFDELARYYAAYERLMTHWRSLLGGRLHEIVYEDLVRDPQRLGAAAAEFCGLNWSPDAIEIQRNAAVSLTASAAQVRRPIYGTSSGRWRLYRAQLDPLVESLRRAGAALPPDA